MEKHEVIIQTALQMFSEKGYFSTSVQEIVSSCGISKGSFYNYFASKEDLLIEVFRYNHEQLLKKAKSVHLDGTISAKQQLINMISMELEDIADNREFFLLLQRVVPMQEYQKLLPLMKKTKAAMINLHKDWLLHVYGDRVRNQIWDHVLFLHGAMKEYIGLVKENNTHADPEVFARGITAKLDILVEYGRELDPILTDEWMSEYEEIARHPEKKTKEEERDEQLALLHAGIQKMPEDNKKTEELVNAAGLLEEEWRKQEPRLFLIRALLDFLTRPGLEQHIEKLKNLHEQECRKEGR
ncbi:TetR/AcrR family transcriptional regulator [Salibacterium sp. K-3]